MPKYEQWKGQQGEIESVWQPVLPADVSAVVSQFVVAGVDQPLPGLQSTVLQAAIDLRLLEVRGAVRNGNRSPLSLDQGTVPPEGKRWTVFLAAMDAMSGSPQVMNYVDNPWLKSQCAAASTWLEEVGNGKPVVRPSAPDPGTAPTGTRWGDYSDISREKRPLDLSTPGPYTGREPERLREELGTF
jgi:hypothetical protein